jgi:hypothetical protein
MSGLLVVRDMLFVSAKNRSQVEYVEMDSDFFALTKRQNALDSKLYDAVIARHNATVALPQFSELGTVVKKWEQIWNAAQEICSLVGIERDTKQSRLCLDQMCEDSERCKTNNLL